MPNWTSNILRVEGEQTDIRAFLEAVKWEDRIFDFNRIIPMPKMIKHTASGGRTFDGERVTTWFVENPEAEWDKRIERPFTDEEKATLRDIGYDSWYDWSVQHWGTKWNACNAQLEHGEDGTAEIQFLTAWSAPHPVFRKIAELFPDLSFELTWTDEDEAETTHSLKLHVGRAA